MIHTVVYKKTSSGDNLYTHNFDACDVSEALTKFEQWHGPSWGGESKRTPVYVIGGNTVVRVEVVVEPTYRLTKMVGA